MLWVLWVSSEEVLTDADAGKRGRTTLLEEERLCKDKHDRIACSSSNAMQNANRVSPFWNKRFTFLRWNVLEEKWKRTTYRRAVQLKRWATQNTQELLVMQKCKMQQTNKTNPILQRNNTIGVKKLCTQTNWKFYLGERKSRRLWRKIKEQVRTELKLNRAENSPSCP